MVNVANVMIFEDDCMFAAKLKMALENLGYSVTVISQPYMFSVEKAVQLNAHFILTSVREDKPSTYSPGKGIYSALIAGKIKQEKMPPVIYISSNLDNPSFLNNHINIEASGYCCFLNKSFTEMQLKTTINFALEYNAIIPKPNGPFSDILDKYSKDLICLLNELKTGNIADFSLNLLIKVCYELAIANIKRKINRLLNINKRWELSVEDIAVESICNLFVNNSKRKKLNLECFLTNWTDNITDNTDAFFFLNKVVHISIDQYMNKLLREGDPFFAKTIDTFYLVIKNMNYCKLDHFGTVYIVKNGVESLSPSVNLIPAEEFMKISLDKNLDKKRMLKYIMSYLECETEYFPAIPLNLLVARFMNYAQLSRPPSEVPNDLERISVDDIIFNSLEKIIYRMKKTYLNTNKLNINEADYIASALTDVAFDFREGNTIEQLQDYLGVYIKDLTIEVYQAKYRNIFEYLIKIFKKSIAGQLKQ